MNIIAINGSPRKKNNTAQLLQAALEGASAASKNSLSTELIHLYDFQFASCKSCFECKRLGGKYYGRCMIHDSLTSLLEKVSQADGVIFGSPIYFAGMTGKLKSFFERLLFPFSVYEIPYSSIAPKRMPTGFIYTMNVTTEAMKSFGYAEGLRYMESVIGRVFSPPEILYSCDTVQFDNYDLYKSDCFSGTEKKEHQHVQFPLDKEQASRMGAHIALTER